VCVCAWLASLRHAGSGTTLRSCLFIERSRKYSTRPIPATTRKPRIPGTTWLAAGAPEARTITGSPLPDASEQVVFWKFSIHQRPGQVVSPGRPRGRLDGRRAGDPGALGVDLGGGGKQRLVADREVGAAPPPTGVFQCFTAFRRFPPLREPLG